MDSKMIDRINTLHHKAQSVGLTEEEKAEQARLRREQIETIKMNLRSHLDNIDIQEADGTIVNLGEKYGRKKTHQEADLCCQEAVHRPADRRLEPQADQAGPEASAVFAGRPYYGLRRLQSRGYDSVYH